MQCKSFMHFLCNMKPGNFVQHLTTKTLRGEKIHSSRMLQHWHAKNLLSYDAQPLSRQIFGASQTHRHTEKKQQTSGLDSTTLHLTCIRCTANTAIASRWKEQEIPPIDQQHLERFNVACSRRSFPSNICAPRRTVGRAQVAQGRSAGRHTQRAGRHSAPLLPVNNTVIQTIAGRFAQRLWSL